LLQNGILPIVRNHVGKVTVEFTQREISFRKELRSEHGDVPGKFKSGSRDVLNELRVVPGYLK